MEYTASASAKTILFGEHAVVYGEPAIAIPLSEIRTEVKYRPESNHSADLKIISSAFPHPAQLSELPRNSGITSLFRLLQEADILGGEPTGELEIRSQIPIASGLGSGAALSIALIRCFLKATKKKGTDEQVNHWAYQIEKIYHGNPSGIDNTVICYEKPLIFRKGDAPRLLKTPNPPLPLLVIDSGIRSETIKVVASVRESYPKNAGIIQAIGKLTQEAISEVENGNIREVGRMMNENQLLLRALGVSSAELDNMASIALENGAIGAKLTGAGAGGNLLALSSDMDQAKSLKKVFESKGYKTFL